MREPLGSLPRSAWLPAVVRPLTRALVSPFFWKGFFTPAALSTSARRKFPLPAGAFAAPAEVASSIPTAISMFFMALSSVGVRGLAISKREANAEGVCERGDHTGFFIFAWGSGWPAV